MRPQRVCPRPFFSPALPSPFLIPVLFLFSLLMVSMVTLWLCRLVPGTHRDAIVANSEARTFYLVDRDESFHGGDFATAYRHWLVGTLKNGLGESEQWQRPVTYLIGTAAIRTLAMAAIATLFTFLITVWMGSVYVRASPSSCNAIQFVLGALTAIPTHLSVLLWVSSSLFVASSPYVGAVTIWVLAGVGPMFVVWAKALTHFQTMPCFITARAMGCHPTRIYYRHALAYTWIQCRETLWQTFFSSCAGSVVLEVGLGLRGLGSLAWDSWRYRDFPTIMGLSVFFATLHWLMEVRRPACVPT